MNVLNPADIGTALPIKVWEPEGKTVYADNDVYQQLRNLANHPLARKWVCAMPDYHLGYGMPIGGVLATRGGVVPNAVGVDIGCGMVAVRTNIDIGGLDRDILARLRAAIHGRVPVGMSHHTSPRPMPQRLSELADGSKSGLGIVSKEWQRAMNQIGTLGGGNHFIELQAEDSRFDADGTDCAGDKRLWIMIHSGSRNVGKQVCDHYHKVALDYMTRFHSQVPDKDLAFLPEGAPEHDAYLDEMRWCMAFAEESRATMLQSVHGAIKEVLGIGAEEHLIVDTHHNFAALEHHYGENLWVHRKGAVKAEGLVTIPGSMGTASYICEGLRPAESFNTCSHGAGRVMGRGQANRTITHEQAVESMKHVVFGVREGDYDETPMCYKPIEKVIEAQADLVRPLYRLLPLVVVKG